MINRIRSFYQNHPVLFINLFALALWIAINIFGGLVLALFGRNKLPEQIVRPFITLYVILFCLWLGKEAIARYKVNTALKRRARQIGWAVYAALSFCLALILMIGLL